VILTLLQDSKTTTESTLCCSVRINFSEMLENHPPPYRTHKSQEALRQNGFETTFWPARYMSQSGAQSKKPRVVRGFRRLPFAYSQLEVNVLAERVGFEPTVPCGTLDFESSTFDHSATAPELFASVETKREFYQALSVASPPMYERSGSGMVMEPSAFW
jgi:hypothetical protein